MKIILIWFEVICQLYIDIRAYTSFFKYLLFEFYFIHDFFKILFVGYIYKIIIK